MDFAKVSNFQQVSNVILQFRSHESMWGINEFGNTFVWLEIFTVQIIL